MVGASWRGHSNSIRTLIFVLFFLVEKSFMRAEAGPLVEVNDEVPSLWTKLPEMAMVNSVLSYAWGLEFCREENIPFVMYRYGYRLVLFHSLYSGITC